MKGAVSAFQKSLCNVCIYHVLIKRLKITREMKSYVRRSYESLVNTR